MKYLLEAMRVFHYAIGITTPKPEDERKILFLWIAIVITLLLLGTAMVLWVIPHLLR